MQEGWMLSDMDEGHNERARGVCSEMNEGVGEHVRIEIPQTRFAFTNRSDETAAFSCRNDEGPVALLPNRNR
jgi:hypothetical protein